MLHTSILSKARLTDLIISTLLYLKPVLILVLRKLMTLRTEVLKVSEYVWSLCNVLLNIGFFLYVNVLQ